MDCDWLELWRDMATAFHKTAGGDGSPKSDSWQGRARRFDASVKRKLAQPDPLRDFVLSQMDSQSTAIDIGAGTGSWTIPLARAARRVTAVEPSEAMTTILKENLASEGIKNVELIQSRWEEAEVGPHDVAICSHAMYTSPDLLGFVGKMERAALKRRFLLMKVPSHEGALGELSQLIHGQWHDSPNFIVAYNALLSAGIYANVMIESTLRPWTNESFEEAFLRAKNHLRLGDGHTYDDHVWAVLQKKLTLKDGLYYWPDGMRSALVWW